MPRSRSPTNARWRARCARISRRRMPACRSSSAASSRSPTAPKLVLLATDRASYGDLSQLITRGRRQRGQGRVPARARRRRGAGVAMPRAVAARARSARREPRAARRRPLGRATSSRPRVDRRRAARAAPATRARLARSTRAVEGAGLPLVAAGDVHMHVRARRALQDTLTAIRLKTPLAACGHALFPNGERHLRSRARLARHLSAGAARGHASASPSAAVSRSTSCATNIRTKSSRPARRRRRGCASSSSAASRRYGENPDSVQRQRGPLRERAGDVRALIEHELALIAELRYEPYFLTVQDIVAFARIKDPLPGPRIGGQRTRRQMEPSAAAAPAWKSGKMIVRTRADAYAPL